MRLNKPHTLANNHVHSPHLRQGHYQVSCVLYLVGITVYRFFHQFESFIEPTKHQNEGYREIVLHSV